MKTITNEQHKRLMDKRNDIADRIKAAHTPLSTDERVQAMIDDLSEWLSIPREKVAMLDRRDMGHIDYLSKFSLHLAEEYFGLI